MNESMSLRSGLPAIIDQADGFREAANEFGDMGLDAAASTFLPINAAPPSEEVLTGEAAAVLVQSIFVNPVCELEEWLLFKQDAEIWSGSCVSSSGTCNARKCCEVRS